MAKRSSYLLAASADIGQDMLIGLTAAGTPLTNGVDNIVGTDAGETFIVPEISAIGTEDKLNGGLGIDTLLLNSSSWGDIPFDLYKMANLSGIEIIRGSDKDERISVLAGQLADVLTIDGGTGSDVLNLQVGSVFDLTGKHIENVESIRLSLTVQEVRVDNLATAQLIDGRVSQNDHLILTNDELNDEDRQAYFLRGIDKITDKTGRMTENKAPQLTGLDGDKVRTHAGGSVLLNDGNPISFGDEDTDLATLQFFIWDRYGNPDSFFEIREWAGLTLSNGMNPDSEIVIDGIAIGKMADSTDQWFIDIAFYDAATPALAARLVQAIAYKNTSTDDTLTFQDTVWFYIGDKGERFTEATVQVAVASDNTFILTAETDRFLGTDASEIFITDNLTLDSSDAVDGAGGIDTLQLIGGAIDLRRPEILRGIEILRGSNGMDIIEMNAERLKDFVAIQGGSGHDEIHLEVGEHYDLRGKIIAGIEVISVQFSSTLIFDDKGTALLTRAVPGITAEMVLQGASFTEAERAQLFRQGITEIEDAGGTHTNAAPDQMNLSHTTIKELTANGTVVGVLSAEDPNPGDSLKFELLNDAGGRFKLAADGKSIIVANNLLLDYEQSRSYTISVKVTDKNGAGLTYGRDFTITLVDARPENVSGSATHDYLVGGDSNDIFRGNSGNDTLNGGKGNDVLRGGAGKDVFVFNTTPSSKSNKDKITDWSAKDDTIQLENTFFKALKKTGTLSKGSFVVGSKALQADDFVGYNKSTGDVWYDANGNKAGGQVMFANVGKYKAIAYNDFSVI